MVITKPRARAVKQPGYPQLLALSEGVNIPLDKPIMLIGRHQECDIQNPSRKISRRHCCIALISDHLVIRDLGSTNGIRINGIKVVEGNLQPNDEVTIGNVRYQVKWADEMASGSKNGNPAAPAKKRPADESCEEPMPLSEIALAQPAHASSQSKATPPAKPDPKSLQVPDDVGLVPLDPPQK